MVPELHPDVWGVWKKFQITDLTMPYKIYLMNFSPQPIPGVADIGVPHGGEDGPVTQAPGSGSKITTHHVDQHEKLKGLDVQKATLRP